MIQHMARHFFSCSLLFVLLLMAACQSGERAGNDGDLTENDDPSDGDMDIEEENDGDDALDGDSNDDPKPDGDLEDTPDGDLPPDGDILPDGDSVIDGDSDDDSDGDADDDEEVLEEEEDLPDIIISSLFAVENPANVLSFFVEWSTDRPTRTILAVDCGEDIDWTISKIHPLTEHKVFVMGLLQGVHCAFSAQTGQGESKEVEVDVGTIPEELPGFQTLVSHPARIQAGWTLLNLNNSFNNIPLYVAIIDQKARYRWYYKRNTTHPGDDTEVSIIPDGLLIGGNRHKYGPAIVSWEGEVLWEDDFFSHHDIRLYGPDDHIMYLASIYDCPGDAEPYYANSIVEYDRFAEEQVWVFRYCDYYVPPVYREDWSHLNAVVPFPDQENTYLLSSREQHHLYKVLRDPDGIAWKMGLNGDFGLDEQDRFMRQHAPEILSNGNILLFDNGDTREPNVRRWSRALEISYDEDSMTAEAVWSFRPDPDIYSWLWGDADRLPNGNTLVTFGMRSTTNGSDLIEVDSNSDEVWHVKMDNKWGAYRSDRIEAQIGYVIQNEEK